MTKRAAFPNFMGKATSIRAREAVRGGRKAAVWSRYPRRLIAFGCNVNDLAEKAESSQPDLSALRAAALLAGEVVGWEAAWRAYVARADAAELRDLLPWLGELVARA